MSARRLKAVATGILIAVLGTVAGGVALRLLGLDGYAPTAATSPRVENLVVPQFKATLENGASCERFRQFLENNLGKLVEIRVDDTSGLASITEDSTLRFLSFRSGGGSEATADNS